MPTEKHGKAHEQHHAHKEETSFKIAARRNKLAGLWAADLMGLTGADADAYGKEVVMADFEEAGDQDVIRKLVGDLKARQISLSENEVTAKLAELETEARRQLDETG